jgi:uncharacterized alkaline shock family protein YloU
MAVTAQSDRLPCGVALEALVTQIAERRPAAEPEHQTRCPYCQEALRRLGLGWDDLQELTRSPVSIPPALTARITARVRALANQVATHIVVGHPRGSTRISHTVIARIIGRQAAALPGVLFASARPVAHDPPEPGRLGVVIRLVVSFGPPIEPLARALRQRLRRRVPRLTGAELDRIDIVVEDLGEPGR